MHLDIRGLRQRGSAKTFDGEGTEATEISTVFEFAEKSNEFQLFQDNAQHDENGRSVPSPTTVTIPRNLAHAPSYEE